MADPKEIHWYDGDHGDYEPYLPGAFEFLRANLV